MLKYLIAVLFALAPLPLGAAPARGEIEAAMKRATIFMVEKVSTRGGYVWSYLPDMSRRWGEIEARPDLRGAAARHRNDGPTFSPRAYSCHGRRNYYRCGREKPPER